MERKNQVASAVRRALVMGALTAAGVAPALAQENLGEIVVTGSRIRSANLESTTPVTQVTAEDVVTQGVTRIEDLVNQLPQAFAAQNVTVANGSTGTATLNLRGLGSPRTLVLVDGRRLPYGGVTNSAADINQIPTQMVERVDILTGGASAVYGSDAVAGVVNFIMKKDFEGVEVTSQYNTYWHENDYGGPGAPCPDGTPPTGGVCGKLRDIIEQRGIGNPAQFQLPDDSVTDGEGVELSMVMGVNSGDGRGNITAYATVFDSKQVLQANRDYSACSLNPATGDAFSCGGSSTSATGRIITFAGGQGNWTATDDPDAVRPFDFTNDLYNFGPLNHYQRPERRYNIGAMGHYEFNDHADVYTQLMFNDYESIAQIAPGGIFGETTQINCGNPLIPANLLGPLGCDAAAIAANTNTTMLLLRRNVEGGGRQQSFANSTYRMVAGLRGAINDAWSYDVSAQYSSGTGTNATLNYFQTSRVQNALLVDDVNGVPTCQSAISGADPNCVPYNPFVVGGVTQDQLNYLQVKGIQVGRISQEIYLGTVSGDLGAYGIKMPSASDGVQLVFGAEYRRDTLTNTVDALQEGFQLAGTGGPTIGISGATIVEDLFMEARVPLAQDQAWADSLSFDAAYRYSDYGDPTGTTDTYKLGLEWAPIADVRLRGSYQRAVRAANIVELFTAQGFNLFDRGVGDPCGPAQTATTADCIATGVPAANVGSGLLDSPAGQYSFLQGGVPTLLPEESDTYSYGVVFQPRFAPGLAITVDYFDISIDDTISTFGPNNTLTACYDNNDQEACDRINRDPLTGALWLGSGHVENLNQNIGSLETTGYDINIAYSGLEMGRFGSLAFNLTGTYVVDLTTQPAPGVDLVPGPSVDEDTYDCVGFYSSECGTPTPQWRHRFRTSWQTPWDLDLSLTWRYYGEVTKLDDSRLVSSPDDLDHTLSAEDYFDIAANWAVTEKASVTLGINNVLDDNPSLSGAVGTTGNGNTYPQTYDALGRYLFVRATVEF